jgi:hypothetical protein
LSTIDKDEFITFNLLGEKTSQGPLLQIIRRRHRYTVRDRLSPTLSGSALFTSPAMASEAALPKILYHDSLPSSPQPDLSHLKPKYADNNAYSINGTRKNARQFVQALTTWNAFWDVSGESSKGRRNARDLGREAVRDGARTVENMHGQPDARTFRKHISHVISDLKEAMPHLSRRGAVLDHIDNAKDVELKKPARHQESGILPEQSTSIRTEIPPNYEKYEILQFMTCQELPVPRILYQSPGKAISRSGEVVATYSNRDDTFSVMQALDQCNLHGQRFWVEYPANLERARSPGSEVKEQTFQKGGRPSKKWSSSGHRLLVRFATAASQSFTFIQHALEEDDFTVR